MTFGLEIAAAALALVAQTSTDTIEITQAQDTTRSVKPVNPAPQGMSNSPLEFDQLDDELLTAEADVYNRLTVPVTIEGEGPFRFMIDTGAQATVITDRVTDKVPLEPQKRATVVGMGGRKVVDIYRLDGLEFAERVLDNIDAPLLHARHVGADGILGADSLQDLRVLIDFRDETISVNDSESLGGNSGYEIVVRARRKLGRLIITEAEIDGIRTAVVVDTGAQMSFGNARLLRKLRSRKREEVSSTDVLGTTIVGNRHMARSLTIQNLELSNFTVTFADSPAFAALGLERRPALILGMRDLRLFDRVAIDFASRKVLFDLPKGAPRSSRPLNRRSRTPSRL